MNPRTSTIFIPIFFLVTACGSTRPESAGSVSSAASEGAISETSLLENRVGDGTSAGFEKAGPKGTISRVALNRFLAVGPAAILALVETEAVVNRGAFVGFKITAFTEGPPKVVDLRVGDIVVSVNEKRVERPEQFFAVIETLKKAQNLQLVVIRKQSPKELNYPITD